jgi:hypothetical protein
MGALISKLWTPMKITEERRLKSMAVGGGAPPHDCGGWSIPSPLLGRAGPGLGGGQGQVRPDPGQPPVGGGAVCHKRRPC